MTVHFSFWWKFLTTFSLLLLIARHSTGVENEKRKTRQTDENDQSLFKKPQQYECQSEGFHANPFDCSIFHLCVDKSQTSLSTNTTDHLVPDSFISITFECNPGFFFDRRTDSCLNATKSPLGECLRNTPDNRFAGNENPPVETTKPTTTKKPIPKGKEANKKEQQQFKTTTAKNNAKWTTKISTPSAKNETENDDGRFEKSSTVRTPLVSVSVQNGNDYSNRINFALDTSYPRHNSSQARSASHSTNDNVESRFNDNEDERDSNQPTEKTNKPVIYILPQLSQPQDDGTSNSNQSTTTASTPQKSTKSAERVTKKPLVLVVRKKNATSRNTTESPPASTSKTNQSKTSPPVKRPSVYLEPPPPPSSSKNATTSDNESQIIYIIPPPGTLQNSALFGSQPANKQNKGLNEHARDDGSTTEPSFRFWQDGNEQEPDSTTTSSQYYSTTSTKKYVSRPSIYLLPPTSLSPEEAATLSPPDAVQEETDFYPKNSGVEDTGDNTLGNDTYNLQPTTYHPQWENGSNRRNDRSSTPQPTWNEYDSYTHDPNVDVYSPLPEGQQGMPSIRLLPPTQYPSQTQSWQISTPLNPYLSNKQPSPQNYDNQNALDSRSNFNSQSPPQANNYGQTDSPPQFWRTFNPYSSSNPPLSQSNDNQGVSKQSNVYPQWQQRPQQGYSVTTKSANAYPTKKQNNRPNQNGLESRSGLDSQWDDSVPSLSPPLQNEYTETDSNQNLWAEGSTPANYYDSNIHYYTDANNGPAPQQVNIGIEGYSTQQDQLLETSTPIYGYPQQQQLPSTPIYGYDPQQRPEVTPAIVTYGRNYLQTGAVCIDEGFFAIENDCSRFYRCVSAGSGFQRFTFSCGPGTVWDANINACNHGWAARRQDCGSY